MAQTKMRILVIGGTGYIGAPVVRQLATAGHELTVFHRGQTKADFPSGVRHLTGNRQQLPAFRKQFAQLAPQVVLDVMPYFEEDARALLETFQGFKGRLVALSSQDVYRSYGLLWRREEGAPNVTPIDEDAPVRSVLYPYRPYAEGADDFKYNYDKIPVERLLMSAGEWPATILRLPAVYGVGDRKHRLFECLKRMDDGRPFILLEREEAGWRWTHGYIENVVDAIALAVTDERAAGRIYNVGEPDALTRMEWVESIGRAAGWRGRPLALERDELPEHLRSPTCYTHDLFVDTGRIRRELGYTERVGRDEALRRTIVWERAHPPAEIDPQQFDYAAEDAAIERWRQSRQG